MMSFNKKSTFLFLTPLLLAIFLVQACGDGPSYYRQVELTPPEPYDTAQAVDDTTTDDGLTIYVLEEGEGRPEKTVTARDQVYVRYTGRTEDGKAFDSSYKNGSESPAILQNLTPVPKTSANGQTINPLIDGFRRGLLGMAEGEKRTLVIPPELGYGDPDKNYSGSDLEDKTLRFDIELVEIL
ncbi:FKBP-type peptidyl-prolyl cis-trans isomerase [Fodinibius sediminis]|uniref:Peptidyl-prolyl cis-trans isomerase n=1 Tax=Fodinibius sediminis TaxID=1214077 RepID=A0A521DZ05_9BACT|nr:FKBP-type peptidyl-prolyl cis-trans isomerase [Fodinibius sediminis]SMO76110.1 FKBP-type peptidyl-prolyl cis-trans isomerase [Fodinibius sediminis]